MAIIRIPIWVNLIVAVILLTAYARFISIWAKFWLDMYNAVLTTFSLEGIKTSFKKAFEGFTILPICDYLGPFGAMIKQMSKLVTCFEAPFEDLSDFFEIGEGPNAAIDEAGRKLKEIHLEAFKDLYRKMKI